MTATKPRSTKLHRAKATGRHPKFTTLETAIILNGVSQGTSKALAIRQLREWENSGQSPEEIAERLGIDTSTGQPTEKPDVTPAASPEAVDNFLDDCLGGEISDDEE